MTRCIQGADGVASCSRRRVRGSGEPGGRVAGRAVAGGCGAWVAGRVRSVRAAGAAVCERGAGAAGWRGGAGADGGVHGAVGAVVDRRAARAGAGGRSVVERGDGGGGGAGISIRPASGPVARRVEIEFVGDRLADARLAQAYVILAPERRRVTRNERSDDERAAAACSVQTMERSGRVAAIYARVSSDRQRREQTIRSQTAALRELAAARGLLVVEDLVFEDEGVSGTVLRRPGLERLRDLAVEGRFEVLLCHAPDRLARRYAYQVLLLEEFQRAGIEVIFAKEPERSGTPEDELLRQFQGMIAEYERAQIAERCRRGKLHRARGGAVSVMARAPYGYRYVKRSEHADAFFEVDEAEAPVVREIFRRYLEEGESIAKIGRWLTAQGVPTRTGATGWNNATIWGMLRNPAYAGQAAYGKTRATGEVVRATRQARLRGSAPPASPARMSRQRSGSRSRSRRSISEEQFALAQAATGAQQPLLAAQHLAPVAAAGHPRLSRVRVRLLPLLDPQQEREAARVLPLLGHRRPPPPRRPRLREPTGPPRRGRRARLDPSARAARRPRADPGRNRPPASDDARDAPRRQPTRRARARPHPLPERDPTTAGRLPGAARHARRAPRPHPRAAQTRGHDASAARRTRRRAARRRDLPQAHRDTRRLPRPARRPTPRT